VRSPLWGRAQETYGEDPLLTASLAGAFVGGAQTADTATEGGAGRLLAGACCKHLAAYDLENHPAPRILFNAVVRSRDMFESYLAPFRACVLEQHALHVMCSFNSINGVPACGDPQLLNGVLREKWNWTGFVVSDYDAWSNLYDPQHYAANLTDAAAKGINAGLDQEGGGTAAISQLGAAVAAGTVAAGAVAESVRRLFRARLALGMLDPPTSHAWNELTAATECQSAAKVALSRELAEQGVAMYRNVNGTLPLPPPLPYKAAPGARAKSGVVVIGPFADDGAALLGNYATAPAVPGGKADPVSILTGVRERLGDGVDVIFQPGCAGIACPDRSLFAQAAASASAAEATILVLGTQVSGPDCRDDVACEGEGHDRTSVALAGEQQGLAAVLAQPQTGSPLVCVLVHGGTLALGALLRHCDAILDAGFPGPQGGPALARTLFGDVSPAGRAPSTWYADDAVVGAGGAAATAGNMDLYSAGLTYRFVNESAVAVPFGAGLSYTSFEYSDAQVRVVLPGGGDGDAAAAAAAAAAAGGAATVPAVLQVGPCDELEVSVDVSNVGAVGSDEVAQLYVTGGSAKGALPRIRLVNFTRIHVAPRGHGTGAPARQRVALLLGPRSRVTTEEVEGKFWEPRRVLREGPLTLHIGGAQPGYAHFAQSLALAINVTSTADLASCECTHSK